MVWALAETSVTGAEAVDRHAPFAGRAALAESHELTRADQGSDAVSVVQASDSRTMFDPHYSDQSSLATSAPTITRVWMFV